MTPTLKVVMAHTLLTSFGIALIIMVVLVLRIKRRNPNRSVDTYYVFRALEIAKPDFKIKDIDNEYVSIVYCGLYHRVSLNKPAIECDILEILHNGEAYNYKFQHIAEIVDYINDTIADYGCKERVDFRYNRYTNKVNLQYLLSKVERGL